MLTIKLAPMIQWTKRTEIAVHQVLEDRTDLENALHNADRDGFDCIVLYIPSTKAGNFKGFLKHLEYVKQCVPDANVVAAGFSSPKAGASLRLIK